MGRARVLGLEATVTEREWTSRRERERDMRKCRSKEEKGARVIKKRVWEHVEKQRGELTRVTCLSETDTIMGINGSHSFPL